MNTGEKIKSARIKAGYTQKKLAELSGVAEITIRQYETGKREPRNKQLIKIAKELNVNFYDLIGQTPEEQKEHSQKLRRQVLDDSIMKRRKNTLLMLFEQLNHKGVNKAIEQVALLTKIPEYQKNPAPGTPSQNIGILIANSHDPPLQD